MLNQKQINLSLQQPDTKRDLNKELFTVIAKRYALITQLLSFGYDHAWKKNLVQQLPEIAAPHCLDLACGTGDICALLAQRYPHSTIVGLDLTPAMLAIAKEKHSANNITFIQADMCTRVVASNSMDIITGGYALRNAPSLDQLLQQVWEALKPGGTASFLDFAKSDNTRKQGLQMRLLKLWTSIWGILLHANPAIYNYIPASLHTFPSQKALQEKITGMGFIDYKTHNYHHGFVSQIYFTKPK